MKKKISSQIWWCLKLLELKNLKFSRFGVVSHSAVIDTTIIMISWWFQILQRASTFFPNLKEWQCLTTAAAFSSFARVVTTWPTDSTSLLKLTTSIRCLAPAALVWATYFCNSICLASSTCNLLFQWGLRYRIHYQVHYNMSWTPSPPYRKLSNVV